MIGNLRQRINTWDDLLASCKDLLGMVTTDTWIDKRCAGCHAPIASGHGLDCSVDRAETAISKAEEKIP